MDEGSGILWGHHLALSWWDLHLPAEMQTAAGPGKHQHTQMIWGCIYMVVVFLGFSSDAGQSREKEGRMNTSERETGKREPFGETKHPKPWDPVLLPWSL